MWSPRRAGEPSVQPALVSCAGGARDVGGAGDAPVSPRPLAGPSRLPRGVGHPAGAGRRARGRHPRPGPAAADRARRRADARPERQRRPRRRASRAPRRARHRGRPGGARRRGDVPRTRPAGRVPDRGPRQPRRPGGGPAHGGTAPRGHSLIRGGPRGGDGRHVRRPGRDGRPPGGPSRLLGRRGRPAPPQDRGDRHPRRPRGQLPRHCPQRDDQPGRLRPHQPLRDAGPELDVRGGRTGPRGRAAPDVSPSTDSVARAAARFAPALARRLGLDLEGDLPPAAVAADERRALEDLAARLRDLELAAKPARGRGLRAGAAAEAS